MGEVADMVGHLMAQRARDRRAGLVFTVLTRGEGSQGTWHPREISAITENLQTEVYGLPAQPQYLVLAGGYTKPEVLKAMSGGQTFTAETLTGLDNEKLPFQPSGY